MDTHKVVLKRGMNGDEVDRLLREVLRWADTANDVQFDWRDENTLELFVGAPDRDQAVRAVEDVLTAASPTWGVHVQLLAAE